MTMPDSDRELLVRMDERLRAIQAQLVVLTTSVSTHDGRIRNLELTDAERKGEARLWGAISGVITGGVVGAVVSALMRVILQ